MNGIYAEIIKKAEKLLPSLIERRRDFHKYAESGWMEIRTASIIADTLEKLGYEVIIGRDALNEAERLGLPDKSALDAAYERAIDEGAKQPYAEMVKDGFTAVVGVLHCPKPGPVIGMRFDIDALGVFESEDESHLPKKEGFRSVNEGTMHACGHDGHASIGLHTAEILMSLKAKLKGTVKLVFQPAEEGVRGARAIAKSGILDDVDYMIGNHLSEGRYPAFKIGYSNGGSLATSKLDVYFYGKACHAGGPNEGDNAMLAAAAAVLNLHAIPRHADAATRVNVGTLHAGSGRNVICDRAKLEIEVRGSTSEANEYMEAYARRIVEAAAAMHGCTCEIRLMGQAPSLFSDREMNERLVSVCKRRLSFECSPPFAGMGGSEDYSYMADRVREHGGKSLFFYTLTDMAGAGHSTTFNFGEEAMVNAVKVFCALACDLMGI